MDVVQNLYPVWVGKDVCGFLGKITCLIEHSGSQLVLKVPVVPDC